MPSRRSILLCLGLGLTLPAIASEAVRRAPILPEVDEHLRAGHDEVARRRPEIASAHADAVLIGDSISYSVEFDSDVPKTLQDSCVTSLNLAMDNWEAAVDRTVEFVPVDTANKPTVVIHFRREVKVGREPVAGFATWKRRIELDGDRVKALNVTADLQIRTINVNGRAMPKAAMTHEVMHELGHVLGLEDSNKVGELMGPLDVRRPVSAPLPFESKAVEDLRSEAKEIKQLAQVSQ